jgi:NTE family protein
MRGTKLDGLSDPDRGDSPRFVFCATNVGTGACWHFHGGPFATMGDFYTGYFCACEVSVAEAVAASSAFPPGFGRLKLRPRGAPGRKDPWGITHPESPRPGRVVSWKAGSSVTLTDGGVYDNSSGRWRPRRGFNDDVLRGLRPH